jgi:hypothetical protein
VRTFYQTLSVRVTEQSFQVRGRPPRRIDDLRELYIVDVRGAESPQRTLGRTWPAMAVVVACVVVAGWDLASGRQPSLLVPAVILLVSAIMLILTARTTDSISELWAITETGHVCLFRSRDRHVFGQVRRAVERARESRHA